MVGVQRVVGSASKNAKCDTQTNTGGARKQQGRRPAGYYERCRAHSRSWSRYGLGRPNNPRAVLEFGGFDAHDKYGCRGRKVCTKENAARWAYRAALLGGRILPWLHHRPRLGNLRISPWETMAEKLPNPAVKPLRQLISISPAGIAIHHWIDEADGADLRYRPPAHRRRLQEPRCSRRSRGRFQFALPEFRCRLIDVTDAQLPILTTSRIRGYPRPGL